MKTMHRNFQGVASEPQYFIGENSKSEELKGAKARLWLKKLKKGSKLLATAAHSCDQVLCDLAARGVEIYFAHWHSTGIAKNLPPLEIAAQFSSIPEETLYRFVPRPDLMKLRKAIQVRTSVQDFRKAMMNQRGAIIRDLGLAADKLPAYMRETNENIDDEVKSVEPVLERELIKLAKDVPECQMFNSIFGMKNGYVVAGEFVARTGDASRFPTVSSFFRYHGQHVVNGHAPKRERGKPSDWNSKTRTVLWKTIDAGLKNNNPIIRPLYEEYKIAELAAHDEKHPGCKAKEGHCGARARRRVTKELLTRYYNMAGGPGRPREVEAA